MSNATAGTVQVFKLKPAAREAIQFTGKNGKDVAEFVKSKGVNIKVRNGGNYVKVGAATVRKTDMVQWNPETKSFWVSTVERFREVHTVGKNNHLV